MWDHFFIFLYNYIKNYGRKGNYVVHEEKQEISGYAKNCSVLMLKWLALVQ